ncbi:MAG: CDP-alcohol phosphatidyltransferase family protein [Kofleriaceae bacterium]|nr:CDP-alcohol phosphatidyltransferase family protein [Kofleriaceae bacterium]MBE7454470.1 CDP-alcohol phosphatidyltransferase family protein [Kofleriaceae bacterium]MCL4228087.1 CDP-alcohol phosphatidyltransferase family protein [Myxococcales bacterium]
MTASPGTKRPLITANMVTFARLLPMPLVSWWVYQGQGDKDSLWLALVVGTLIGCTDFIDGYLARKHGPTVLGGLMDPIADKVFIAFAYVPFADTGLVPAWAVALMFVREFFVTGLRSAYEQRDLTLKTSYLAKAKTWTQMQGIGVIVLFPLLDFGRGMTYLFWVGILGPLVAAAALYAIKRKLWPGAFFMSAAFVAILLVHLRGDHAFTLSFCMGLIVIITWVSGIDYVVGGWNHLRGRGDFNRADAVRLASAVVLPVAVFAALVESPAPAWPVITVLALELAVGGLDNLLSHHRKAVGALGWGVRALGASALLGAAALVDGEAATWLAIAAAAITTVGVSVEFWRGRDYYIDARIRDLAARDNGRQVASASEAE